MTKPIRCSLIVWAAFLITPALLVAQQKPLHINPVIAKLAEGKTVYGLNTGDLSLVYAREVARFLMGMTDKAMVLKKGNLQPNVALFARFPPEADQSQWVVKQALDIGLHGVIFNGVDTREQALIAVKSMRYPQLKGSPYYEPNGIRGSGPANATWIWGISGQEYDRHADLWPLNPEGDLLAILMIESVEGLQNLDAIASTPGVGALFVTHKVACAISANTGNDIARRVKEGWNIIRSTVPAINEGRVLLGEK